MSLDSVKVLSDVTVHMKYAKFLPAKQRRETWQEICYRNRDMHLAKYPSLHPEIVNLYNNFVIPKKILPSMRSMQFAGKPIQLAPNRLYNCCALPIDDYRAFNEIMFLLLGGSGVGFSVQRSHIDKLPPITQPTRKRRYVVADSIEGWADAVKVLIKGYLCGKSEPEFDFSDIRSKGEALITSGGKAPGPDPLKECLFKLKLTLEGKPHGSKLTSLEVHDMVCIIADAVLAGGIRRAALISLFDVDDEDMLTCKFGTWWETHPHRGRANNSAVVIRSKITETKFKELWGKIEASGSGEPGIYFSNDFNWLTNPCCFTGSAKLLTSEGYISFSELSGREGLKLINHRGEIHSGSVWSTGFKPTVLVKADNGVTTQCTADHRFMLLDESECQAKDLVGKQIKTLIQASSDKYPTILSVEEAGECEVFDFNLQDDTHWGVVDGGFIAHNCEIALRPFQFCNLVEVNASDVIDQADLEARSKAASLLATLQAGYTNFHYLRDIWRRTTEKDALIGVSMTGIASGAVLKLDLTASANIVVAENKRVASLIGINSAARTTCVKPAGTTSLVLGSSSGIHAWHDEYYLRRVRVGKNEAIYKYLAATNPDLVEDEYFKPNQQAVISVPVKAPAGAIFRTESPIELLDRVKQFSTQWVRPGHIDGHNTHNVSATISVKDDEWDEVGKWMWDNRNCYNGLSVLPYDGGNYKQAPFESITKERYEELSAKVGSIDLTKVVELTDDTDMAGEVACGGGGCEVI